MNEFQILDAEEKAIDLNELDAQACELWKKEQDVKWWTSPAIRREGEKDYEFMSREMSANWFDQLGMAITNQENYYKKDSWKNVIYGMLNMNNFFFKENENEIEIVSFEITKYKKAEPITEAKLSNELAIGLLVKIEYVQPYVQLANYWHSKGYTPKCVTQ